MPAPLPQNLPGGDQLLDRLCTRFPLRRALPVGCTVSVFDCRRAQQRQIPLELLQFLFGERHVISDIGATTHTGTKVAYSLFVRLWGIIGKSTNPSSSRRSLNHSTAAPFPHSRLARSQQYPSLWHSPKTMNATVHKVSQNGEVERPPLFMPA